MGGTKKEKEELLARHRLLAKSKNLDLFFTLEGGDAGWGVEGADTEKHVQFQDAMEPRRFFKNILECDS